MLVLTVVRICLLVTLAAGMPASPSPATAAGKQPENRVFLALAELDEAARTPLWPGFDPREIPFEIYDDGRTWLLRHPHPPFGFQPVPGRSDAWFFEGRHETARANTSAELGGVATAQASFEGKTSGPRGLAALLAHEAFHVFQSQRHPAWGANEAELFLYPVEDAEALALRRAESEALSRAVAVSRREAGGHRTATAAWTARALDARRARFARLPAGAAAYERGTELKEGLARYIETRVTGTSTPAIPAEEFPAARIRDRSYESGCAIAILLDALEPGWKDSLEATDAFLDELLGRAVKESPAANFSPAEMAAFRMRAAADVSAWAASRATLRQNFLKASGWRLVVDSASPLFPQGFDPLNVERIPPSEVLHTRFVKVGNASGSLEVLDRSCLTDAGPAARHPLFEGVRRATVTGLSEEPGVETDERGAVRIRAPGVTLDFRHAHAKRSGETITVSVDEIPPDGS